MRPMLQLTRLFEVLASKLKALVAIVNDLSLKKYFAGIGRLVSKEP